MQTIIKFLIILCFTVFLALPFAQAKELKTSQRVGYLWTTIKDSIVNTNNWGEYFLSSNFDVYKTGNQYINNYCNTQDRYYLIDEKQDIYDTIVRNAFRFSEDQIILLKSKALMLSLEIEFLRNLDEFQDIAYGDKVAIDKGDEQPRTQKETKEIDGVRREVPINEFESIGIPRMVTALTKEYINIYESDTFEAEIKLEPIIRDFIAKYQDRFDYYELKNPPRQKGLYSQDDCLGGIQQIKGKFESVTQGYMSLKKNSLAREWDKLKITFKLFLQTSADFFTLELFTDKIAKIYEFKENKKYSFTDGLKQVFKKTFPTLEQQYDSFLNQYVNRSNKARNFSNKTVAKFDKILDIATSPSDLELLLSVESNPDRNIALRQAFQEIQSQAIERKLESVVKNQEAEIADVNALTLLSILEKTNVKFQRTSKILGPKNKEDGLIFLSKKVHENQCN